MAYIKFYENGIKSRASLKECTEFHFTDPDVCKEGKHRLIYQYYLDRIGKCSLTPVYRSIAGERCKWTKDKTAEYTYFVVAWEKEEIWPEEALDFAKTFHDEYFMEFPCLISIHEDEAGVYAHFLIRTVDYFRQPVDLRFKDIFSDGDLYYGHEMKLAENSKLPYELRTYFDLIRLMMY